MYEAGKSYPSIVAENRPNKDAGATPGSAEGGEPRGGPEWRVQRDPKLRASLRDSLHAKLLRLRQMAATDTQMRFTTLWHLVYDPDRLAETFFSLRKDGAVGVDRVDWATYDADLEANIRDLSARLRRGAYHAKPVRRVHIPKVDGTLRPLGITTLEDKLVQRVTAEVLQAIYEVDFHDFSYGFRPGRSPHHALDVLVEVLEGKKVNWVLDIDIRAFFDSIDHEWLLRFVEHRIADARVLRHIKKWLKAGVLEHGQVQRADYGTPQGGSISPLLANIYLHYALDNWATVWRKKQATGYMHLVRYADDVVACFQSRHDAERFQEALRQRLARFHLELHPGKTRLLEFGRFAAANRQERGETGTPATFDFLGFTHSCGKTRNAKFCVLRKSQRKKVQAKLKEISQTLRRRISDTIPSVGKWLKQVLTGHYQYYGVPRNSSSMKDFRYEVVQRWKKVLGRRSQKGYVTWERMKRLSDRWLPEPRVTHPYPSQRVTV